MKFLKFIVLGVFLLGLTSGCQAPVSENYTVTFDSDGGYQVPPQEIASGKTILKPDDPEKEGYVFVGWYNGENQYNFDLTVTSDITLTAKWANISDISNAEQAFESLINIVESWDNFKFSGILEIDKMDIELYYEKFTQKEHYFLNELTDNNEKNFLMEGYYNGDYAYRKYYNGECIVYDYSFYENFIKYYFKKELHQFLTVLNTEGKLIIGSLFQTDKSVSARIIYENDSITLDYQNLCHFTLKKTSSGHFDDLDFDISSIDWYYDFSLADNGQEYEIRLKNNIPALTSIPEIPTSYKGLPVTIIGEEAFHEQTQLKEITIPSGIHTIEEDAFYGCNELVNINIPESVVRIESGAFAYTKWYANLDKSNKEIYINNVLYQYIGEMPETYEVKANTVSIADYAFGFTHYLKNVIFPEDSQLKYLGAGAFDGAYNLTNINLPSSVIEIGANAFDGCNTLSRINIPNSVTYLGPAAFANCSNLRSITIPDSITKIYDSTFSGCISLLYAIIPDSVEEIEPSAFSGCCMTYLCQVSGKPEGWMFDPSGTNVVWNFKKTIEDDTFIYAINGNDKATIVGLSPQCTNYIVTVPTLIDNYEIINFTFMRHMFAYSQQVTRVTISNGITSIPERAFEGCVSLTSITIPESVRDIGKAAFRYCRSLKSVTLSSGLVNIDSYAFICCYALESITIPSSVTNIGEHAFYSCTGLRNIIIPANVVSVGSYAFFDCDNLTIYCRSKVCPSGWATDWNPDGRPVTWGF